MIGINKKSGGGKLIQVQLSSTDIKAQLPKVYDKLNVHNFCVIPKNMAGAGGGDSWQSGASCEGLSYDATTGQLSIQMSVSYGAWGAGGLYTHAAYVNGYEIWVNYVK